MTAAGYGMTMTGDITARESRALADSLPGPAAAKHAEPGSGHAERRDSASQSASPAFWRAQILLGNGRSRTSVATGAQNVYLDGRDLGPEDFKPRPEGHTGGALNMVPAYTGYMAVNAITGHTRSWIVGQGHCVAAIDTVNLLLDNTTPAHAERYSLSDEGLTRYVQDFYSYRLGEDGKQDSPLGSHIPSGRRPKRC